MDNYIINSFIHNKLNNSDNIFLYSKRFDITLDKNILIDEIKSLIKKSLLINHNNNYNLTEEGLVVMNDNKYYHSKIIFNFLKKYSKSYKKYELREIREEQKKLRNYLINNKEQQCIICYKNLPQCLLEAAHIKPHCILNNSERLDYNIVEFMCRYCHKLYDKGFISIDDGMLIISPLLNIEDTDLIFNNYIINSFNGSNKIYFDFHYKYIFLKK